MKTILIFLIPYFPSTLHTASVEALPGSLVCLLGQPAIFKFYFPVSDLVTWSQLGTVFFSESEVTEAIQQNLTGKKKREREKNNQPIKFHRGEEFVRSYFSAVTREMPTIL